jgi:hypothetical protein
MGCKVEWTIQEQLAYVIKVINFRFPTQQRFVDQLNFRTYD